MKRLALLLIGAAALLGGSFASNAHAAESYPAGGKLIVAFPVIPAGNTQTVTLTGFCGDSVAVTVTGPGTNLSFTGPITGFSFTAPSTPGDYTITVSGFITCTTPVAGIEGLQTEAVTRGSATGGFTVTAVGSGGPVLTTTTSTSIASEAPVPAATTTTTAAVLASPGGALPTTGSDTSFTLQLAIALAAGGVILLIVARVRRNQRLA